MTIFIDNNATHDHTYYGNGCSGGDGSATPCSTRIIQTADSENQENGTYFSFQAATSGFGGTIETENTNSSDTFCPLGWQLPYSGTGGDYYNKSKSWNYLFNKYSIVDDETSATKVKSYPFSYVYSGYYNWNTGRLYVQSNAGNYWSSTVVSSPVAYLLHTWSSVVRPANTYNKVGGLDIRCVKSLSIPSSTARWKEQIFTLWMKESVRITRTMEMAALENRLMEDQLRHVQPEL